MVATAVLELVQVPPLEGLSVVYSPTQIAVGPVYTVDGLTFMVNGDEASEVQLEPDNVKVKVALPAETAVITP